MPQSHLTEDALLELLDTERPTKRMELWDQLPGVPGLHLRVGPKRMTWYLRYRLRGRHRRLRLGRFPHLALEAARDRAIDAQRQIDDGIDPSLEKRRERPTFGQISEHYLEVHARPNKRSADYDERLLGTYVLAEWAELPAETIQRRDARALLLKLAKRTPTTADRVRALLHMVWKVAVLDELVSENPIAGIPRIAQTTTRTRILDDGEIRAFWRWCEEHDTTSSRGLRLLLLTGQRVGAIRGMEWSEVAGEWWTIPRSRMKRGNTEEPHRVFLSRQARDVLEGLETSHDRWVFPARFANSKHPYLVDVYDAVLKARKDLGVDDWTTHDLRRTAATKLRSLGTAHDVVSAILDHAEAGVTGRHYLDPSAYRREVSTALQALGDEIERVSRGGGVVGFSSHP